MCKRIFFCILSGHVEYQSSCRPKDVIIPNLHLVRIRSPLELSLHHAWEMVPQSILILLSLAVELLAFAMLLKLQSMGLLLWLPRLSLMRATQTMLRVELVLCYALQTQWRVTCMTPLLQGLIYVMRRLSGLVSDLIILAYIIN